MVRSMNRQAPVIAFVWPLVAFVALSVLVSLGVLDGLDRQILESVHQTASPAADEFWLKVNWLGGPFFVAPATAVLALILAARRQFRLALMAAAGVGLSALLNLGLRHAFHRPRPVLWSSPILDHSFVYGYPGGHATLVAALASVLAFSCRSKSVPAVGGLYVMIIGYSSLYLGVHYATDLIAGWILGYAVCFAVSQIPCLREGRPDETP